MTGADTPPPFPARRRVGRAVRGHWWRVAGAAMIAVGTPTGIIAGWASPHDRGWWLLAAGGCAGLGTLLGLSWRGQPTGAAAATTAPDRPSPEGVQPGRVWNVPAPVRSFTGRGTQLAALREQLEAGQRAALVPAAALYGMGGIGKTQLARAYAHRYRDEYRLGWWIPAETPLTTTTALAELAVRLEGRSSYPGL